VKRQKNERKEAEIFGVSSWRKRKEEREEKGKFSASATAGKTAEK
jgi:hypothetical protein